MEILLICISLKVKANVCFLVYRSKMIDFLIDYKKSTMYGTVIPQYQWGIGFKTTAPYLRIPKFKDAQVLIHKMA